MSFQQQQERRNQPLAPLNDAFKFFIANMDFNTTVQDVTSFFSVSFCFHIQLDTRILFFLSC